MRKVIIILAALTITALAYWGYLRLSGSTTLEPPATQSDYELDLPDSGDNAQPIGPTTLIGLDQSYYITRDPVTRQVTRVFGFSRLNNPGSQSVRWEVEKPYILFYESSYQCRIDADNGLIQTERSGTSISPKDGQLEGNVVIHIKPHPGSRMAETTLLLDDLLFSSERTEFSTDGPVRVISSQVELSGRGLVLLINAVDGQVEYLHILDLESLRLKDFVQAENRQLAVNPLIPVNTQKTETQSEKTPVVRAAQDKKSSTLIPPAATQADNQQPDATRRLYQCVIEDNVMIRYGDQIVVAGADQVNIQNVFIARQEDQTPEFSGSTPAKARSSVQPDTIGAMSDTVERPREAVQKETAEAVQPGQAGRDDSRDVVVTCDGGIVVKPMPKADSDGSASAMAIEMNGAPLRIEQVDPQSPDKMTPLAHCGLLQYDLGSDVLKLFTDRWRGDILLGGGSAGRIETEGPVVWDRKGNHARIIGPGTVFFDGGNEDSTDAGQIAFAGQMELFFANAPVQESALHLTAANLTGGMSAQLRGDGTMMTAAETAYLAFGAQNTLTSARLEGTVQFENSDGASSNATANTAVFHFGDNQQLTQANLSGDVRLSSDGGRLRTDEAIIAFAPDETGAIQPSRFNTTAEATLETHNAASKQPPARFEAQSISYDLLTGSGRASGPVKFVFYQPADPNSGLLTEFWPVEINAEGDAEFLAGSGRNIETVIFNRKVRGVQTLQYAAYTETNAFRAEKMLVQLGRSAEGTADIQSITLRDGDVYAESKRTHETLRLAMTRLNCREIFYDRQNERLVATGPGTIEVDNSKAEPTASSGGLDLRGPSFAKIEGFDRIEWSSADRRITADGNADVLRLDYIPMVDGVPSRLIRAAAGRVEMNFADDVDGQNRLMALAAKERVFFEEQGKHILEGYSLEYNANRDGWLSITGTDDRPCMADGARVPYIHYNLNTGQLETRLSTIPGAVNIP